VNREQLMSVLIAPHVTEKTSLAMQNHNQYTFRVRREATKTDVKKAVELHGGEISLKSAVGAGTRFTVVLPLRPAGQTAGVR